MPLPYHSPDQLLKLWRTRLAPYCIQFNSRWEPANHLIYLCKFLELCEQHRITRLLITMPPQHGKSWTTSHHFPAWYLGRNPDHWVIGAAYNETKALDFGLAVKDQLNDPAFKAVFPKLKLRDDSNSAMRMTTTLGGAYMAVGRGGGVTGFPCNVFIVDDPYKDDAEAHSEAVRREIRTWYDRSIYPRMAPKGCIIIIHTRWDEDDMIGWILKEHRAEGWVVCNLPAICETEDDIIHRKVGEPLWPERYTLQELEKRRRNNPLAFQALYQQRPAGAGERMFKMEWLTRTSMNCRYDPLKDPPNHHRMNKLMLVDPANSKGKTADYTAIWVLGLGLDGNFWVLDLVRDRLSLTERGDLIFKLHHNWHFRNSWGKVVYEKYGLQADIDYLNDRMARENYRFPVEDVGGNLPKPLRVARLVPHFEQGRIQLPLYHYRQNNMGVEEDLIATFINDEYRDYLINGGGTNHDDLLDALSRLFDVELTWPAQTNRDYPDNTASKVRQLHEARRQRYSGTRPWMSA